MYYALYKAALKRAKDAKRESLQAFLDAKNIKNKYNLDIYEHDVDSASDTSDASDASDASDVNSPNKKTNPTVDSDLENIDNSESGTVSESESDSDTGNSYTSETLEKPPIQIMDESQSFLVEELF